MERLLQDIIDILPVGVWVTDANGRFVRANPAARAIWRGTGPLQHADGDRFDAWWRRTCERFETMDWGTTQALANGRTRVAGSATIACFDGSTKAILHSAAPVHDNQGRITGAVAIIEDITALTQSEAQWRRREHLLHTMIDLLPVGVWATDTHRRVTLVNPAADRIWSGHDWTRDIDPNDFKGWWADTNERVANEDWAVARALRQGTTSRGSLTHIETLDGAHRTIISWAAPLRDENGGISGAVAVAEDITTLYRAQEQLRAAVSDREHILAIVAHDLRNPLGSIMVGASTAREMAATLPGAEKLQERLGVLLDLSRQMSGLVDDLLSVAVSTGGGKPMLTIEQVSPEALVRQACERAQPLYAEHGIELQCDIGSNLPAVCADVQRIQRVLANLLDNALKYTDPPCRVVISAEERGPVVFSVANGGPALAPEMLEAMFQPFWQANRLHRGAGLGLSICRSILEAHGGSIWAEAARGQRVRVSFALPRIPATASRAPQVDAAAQ
ncbi:MAG TPA: ATP-binding protein [Luteimonas sp.]|jgi:PAS domain S-box-containing protein|nr:ATP-binding protein [Luteimonas sp.]